MIDAHEKATAIAILAWIGPGGPGEWRIPAACVQAQDVVEPTREPVLDGLGAYTRKVTTPSEAAQRQFEQGLNLLFSFNHDEAARSFRQAAEIDPSCEMAWWGVAITRGPNINRLVVQAGPRRGRRGPAPRPPARALAQRAHVLAHRRPAGALGGGRCRQPQGDRVVRSFLKMRPDPGFYGLYISHNYHMLAYAAMIRGRAEVAIGAIDEMAARMPEAWARAHAAIADDYLAMPLEVRMRFGRWDEVLAAPEPDPAFPLARTLRHYARAVAFASPGPAR